MTSSIFQGWNKIAEGWNKIAEGWNKIAKGWNKIAERWNKIAKGWNKIAKGWNKIFGMGNWGGSYDPPDPPLATGLHIYVIGQQRHLSTGGDVRVRTIKGET